ncbi:type VI secretion system protein TssA [Agaribacterium sp. ZY112]|uniref:type VI secretion system protein TssA n=1 Tax=Agaribacterium sp. ZY112 TaxID=3233574 RepID=UPI00352620D7
MSLSHVIDLDALAAPISDEAPQGTDIRADRSPTSDYYTIKDARNSARAAERAAMFDDDEADLLTPWGIVLEVAPKILKGTSKDLEVACWYLEGLIRYEGIAGLRDGLVLIKRLVEEHWEGLYPEPDEDGIETKVAPLTGLNGDGGDGTLMTPVRNVAITNEGDYGEFSFWQFQQARDADRIEDEDEKAARNDVLGYSLKIINDTVAETDLQTCKDIIATLEESLEAYKDTNNMLREHCKHEAPPSTNIANLLDEVQRTARFLYKDKLEAAEAAEQAAEQAAEAEQQATDEAVQATEGAATVTTQVIQQVAAGTVGPITNREDALKRLEDVAKYFRQYEPHTPISPGLERIIGWGRMTVSELMMELLPDDQARGLYSQLTGVMLDGSDTKSYVAPPVTAVAPAPAPAASADAAPAAEPEQPEQPANMGW